MNYEHLKQADPELYASMERELGRQRDHLELIASENFTSQAVMEAVGSHLTNKYAEGYPGARYYGGCDYVDAAAAGRPHPRHEPLPRRAPDARQQGVFVREIF